MENISVNWFDVVAVTFFIVGTYIGRKRGLALELPDLIMWLLIIFLGGAFYESLGKALSRQLGLSPLLCHVTAYLMIAGLIALVFYGIRYWGGEKWMGTNTFGVCEYYLGTVAGGFRFLLILLFILALFHAPQISDADLAKQVKAQNENLGAIYFPPYGMIQRSVFRKSCTGRLVDEYLGNQLVKVYTRDTHRRQNETIYRARQREVDEILR